MPNLKAGGFQRKFIVTVRLFSLIFTGLGDFIAKQSILWTADSLVLIIGITYI